MDPILAKIDTWKLQPLLIFIIEAVTRAVVSNTTASFVFAQLDFCCYTKNTTEMSSAFPQTRETCVCTRTFTSHAVPRVHLDRLFLRFSMSISSIFSLSNENSTMQTGQEMWTRVDFPWPCVVGVNSMRWQNSNYRMFLCPQWSWKLTRPWKPAQYCQGIAFGALAFNAYKT